MKVWVVIGNNGEDYEDNKTWTDAVCATKEAAVRWISGRKEKYYQDQERDDELQKLRCERELTKSEMEELLAIQERWWSVLDFSSVTYKICEYDLFE